MRNLKLVAAGLATVGLFAGACGGLSAASAAAASGSPSAATRSSSDLGANSTVVKTRKIGGVAVLTNAKGFTLYWFGIDTKSKSNCNGSCANFWPPVKGPATASAGVTGKLGTIKRSDGSVQATYRGHPLYTYMGDAKPGQNKGNGLNLSGGVWHEVTVSGAAAPSPKGSPSSSGGGYGY